MKTTVALLFLCFAASPALAQPDESDKVRKARSENELEKTAESADGVCGTKLAVSIDWASFDANPEWKSRSISSYCGEPLDTLRRLCEGAAVKAYVAKSVKRLDCKAVKGKAEWAVVAKDGVIEWRVPPDAVNAGDFAKAQLLRNL